MEQDLATTRLLLHFAMVGMVKFCGIAFQKERMKALESCSSRTTFRLVTPIQPSDPILPWKTIVEKSVHDMRTPLSALRTSVEILKMISGDSDQSRRVIGMVEKQIEELSNQMERLVSDPGSYVGQAAPGRLS